MDFAIAKRDAQDEGLPNPRGDYFANLSIILACISFVFVAARLVIRFVINKKSGPDDYLIIGSLFGVIGMAIISNGKTRNGFGFKSDEISYPHTVEIMKWSYAGQILYNVSIAFSKCSIIFLYLRLFVDRKFRTACYIAVGIIVSAFLAAVLWTTFLCNPVEKQWYTRMDGRCGSTQLLWRVISIVHICTDFMIICLPLNEIRPLNLPKCQKFLLTFLFALGFFVILCTIFRLITRKNDIYQQVNSGNWLNVEPNVAIYCACLYPIAARVMALFPGYGPFKPSSSRSSAHSSPS